MRGDKYAMLRFFAVRSLGELGAANGQVAQALVRVAARDPDQELRKEAVYALRKLPSISGDALDALSGSLVEAGDDELRVRVLEALADLGSAKPSELAGDMLRGSLPVPLKRRVIQALSQNPDDIAAGIILDAAADAKVADFAVAVLEGFPPRTIRFVVSRRLRTETDAGILSVLNALDAVLAD